MDRSARGNTHGAAQAQDRVQHGTNRIRERPAVHHRHRIAQGAGASYETRAIGFKLQFPDGFSVRNQNVRDPDRSLVFGALAPRGDERADVWHELGFDEQLRESGMSDVGCLRRERKFRVGCDLNIARANAHVAERDTADFRVVFGGNNHFQSRSERAIAADDFGVIFEENGFVLVSFDAGGLITSGPDIAGLFVAQIDVLAPVVEA